MRPKMIAGDWKKEIPLPEVFFLVHCAALNISREKWKLVSLKLSFELQFKMLNGDEIHPKEALLYASLVVVYWKKQLCKHMTFVHKTV